MDELTPLIRGIHNTTINDIPSPPIPPSTTTQDIPLIVTAIGNISIDNNNNNNNNNNNYCRTRSNNNYRRKKIQNKKVEASEISPTIPTNESYNSNHNPSVTTKDDNNNNNSTKSNPHKNNNQQPPQKKKSPHKKSTSPKKSISPKPTAPKQKILSSPKKNSNNNNNNNNNKYPINNNPGKEEEEEGYIDEGSQYIEDYSNNITKPQLKKLQEETLRSFDWDLAEDFTALPEGNNSLKKTLGQMRM